MKTHHRNWRWSGLGLLLLVAAGAAPAQQIQREIAPEDVGSAPADSILADQIRGLTISVVDFSGPVSGATVALRLGSKELSARSGPQGRALLDVRRRGQWEIVVSAPGYRDSSGTVSWPAKQQLQVELRSLEEGTPAFAEGNPARSVTNWLEQGEALLEQGQHEQARLELTKALPHLDQPGQAQVRATIARALWLEGKREESVEELEEAIRLDPEADGAQAVFQALMSALGREQEIEARLEQLASERPRSLPTRRGAALPALDPQPAVAHQIGAATLVLTERHAEADQATVFAQLDYPKERRSGLPALDLSSESFDVFVPASYRERVEGEPWGAIIWISPIARGGVRSEQLREVLEQRRLIWIGANNSGNPREVWQRVALALHAAHNAQRLWSVDPARIFVGGYSGGGRTAAMAAWGWPETFVGAVFWMGVDWYQPVPVPFAPGSSWAPRFPKPSRGKLRLVERRSRFAFVTGDRDFNRSETNAVHRAVVDAGFENHVLLQIPDADHYAGLVPEWFERALEAIEPPG